nr:cobyric acid synthase [Phaeovibrio sulfidiphilus]
MLQGTASDVGKSMLVAGLCRAYTRRGLRVRPFKAQNMSNNAALALDVEPLPGDPAGVPLQGEIGRAQALQARACKVAPSIHMNPVLLKPQTEVGSQVVLRGRVLGACPAREYHKMRRTLMTPILESLYHLSDEADLVLVEGAGSGAEAYLRASDITNMRLAEAADLPVILVSDIDRGGTTAALIGSHALLDDADRARVRGYLINKFRGDWSIFQPACDTITERTGWPLLGWLRWFPDATRLPAEDTLALERPTESGGSGLVISVPRLPRVANFDDLDPLSAEPSVRLRWIQPGMPIPADTDVIILPGSQSTRADLEALRQEGWDIDILAHVRRGGRVVGLSGGFHMLGTVVRDPHGVEGPAGETRGLGLLDIETLITPDRTLTECDSPDRTTGVRVTGFETRSGQVTGPGLERPWFVFDDRTEGAVSATGRVQGSGLHRLFCSDVFRTHWLADTGAAVSSLDYEARIEEALDRLADHMEADLDLDALLALAR